ncbi:MAG: aldehyde dehydrogenase family protein [Oscillospiraceae bacterium]|jgi:betaine-aldehyde dehydrogenase|nr:aldehyde dehydrogenase family protein [Oscillospiraceae bacterium]
MDTKLNFIAGKWVLSATGRTREVINPANGEALCLTTESSAADTESAIEAAWQSFYKTREWRDTDAQAKSDTVLKIASLMDAYRDELAMLDTLDNGKPLRESEGDIDDAIHCFRYYAGLIQAPHGATYDVNGGFGPMHSYTIHEPVGVCGQITPWNYPLLMSAWKLAPAISAGNSIVFKPSSNCPLSTIRLFEIFEEAGMPAGSVNLVLGSGGEVGHTIAASGKVDMVTFTGSTKVGQSIMADAVGNCKKVGLELGGKSPNVIFEDCDLDGAVEWAMVGFLFNQGQVCSAVARIYVQESIHDAFVAKLKAKVEAMSIGKGIDNPDIGPVVSEAQMNKVLSYIEKGKEEGATLVTGGYRLTEGEYAKGYFIKPTVFDNCTQDMTIVKEEIFGPVGVISTFQTEAEAIELANDTEYGLAGAVFTKDGAKALRVMREIRAGILWINCAEPTFNGAPWGGYKMSGIGRELGIHGLAEYQEVKQVNIALETGPIGWYEN